jgi:6-phosphogluconolactonase
LTHHRLEILATPEKVAAEGARQIAAAAREAVEERGSFTCAVSGGRTPWAMLARLGAEEVPWERVTLFQVDERVAPDGHQDRNLGHIRHVLVGVPVTVVPMPVDDADLDAAAARYADLLPAHLDLVHLGLGPDGHTASLVPGDPVLEVADRAVAMTAGEYNRRRRMTLTYPALAAATRVLWLVTGADKHGALTALLTGDHAIPAGRVEAHRSLVLADHAAAGRDPGDEAGER